MKKTLFSLVLLMMLSFFGSSCFAETLLSIKAKNGFVITYIESSVYYMLSTARIFEKENGLTINCYGLNSTITMVAIPKEGYVFDYWTGTTPVEGIKTKVTMTGDQSFEAHFKEVTPTSCPECPECPECPVCEVCPACICPECPNCVCPPIPECPVVPPCPECVCPVPPPVPECPECPPCKTDEGYCFINSLY